MPMVCSCTNSELDRLTSGLLALITRAVFVACDLSTPFTRRGLLCMNTEILIFEAFGGYVVCIVEGFGTGTSLHHGCG